LSHYSQRHPKDEINSFQIIFLIAVKFEVLPDLKLARQIGYFLSMHLASIISFDNLLILAVTFLSL